MATLGKQHGRYYLQFYHCDRTPKRKRVALHTFNKRNAEALRSKLERDYLLGTFDPWRDDPLTYDRQLGGARLTIAEASERFLARKQADGRSPGTIATYRSFIGGLVRRVGASLALRDLSSESIGTYVHDTSVKKATRHARFRHVRAFIRWCHKEGLVLEDPIESVAAPDKASKVPKSMTEDELRRMCDALRSDYHDKLRRGACREGELIWYIPAWWFALYTGMRSSEIGRLRWGHIDGEKRLIYIYQQKNKREQTIPLSRRAHEVLRGIERRDPDDYVFVSPRMSRKRTRNVATFTAELGRVFKRARSAAGISRRLTPHCLRHSFCTRLAEAGKSAIVIKEAARHATISTSMIYIHVANEHLKSEIEDVFG